MQIEGIRSTRNTRNTEANHGPMRRKRLPLLLHEEAGEQEVEVDVVVFTRQEEEEVVLVFTRQETALISRSTAAS